MTIKDKLICAVVDKLDELGITDIEEQGDLEVVIGGTQIYEIEGAGTKWAPEKGTRKYNNDAFIVIRRHKPVVSSQPAA